MDNTYTGVAPGTWRGVLKLENRPKIQNKKGEPLPELMNIQFEEVTGGELPFTFDVKYTDEENFYVEIINGEERIKLDDIKIGRDRKTAKDTMWIQFPYYQAYIKAIYEENVMAGEFVSLKRKNYSIPFEARFGKSWRFTELKKEPALDLNGKWEVDFLDEDDPYKAIGEFTQKGNHLTGTFLTETGDYRFLEGTVQANKLYLSCFDGAHAFLFEAKILEDNTLLGSFRSGTHYQTLWKAKRNPDFKLADPYEMTYLKEGYDKFTFAFKNPEGKLIDLEDEAYTGKVKLVQIMGSWCPNCMDETSFLVDYFNKNKTMDVPTFALAFESHRNSDKANQAIRRYKKNLGINYEVVYAGYASKKEAGEVLPMLNKIISFPTLLFIDKKNQVRKIHTGFSGPATSKYDSFTKEFDAFLKELVAEE